MFFDFTVKEKYQMASNIGVGERNFHLESRSEDKLSYILMDRSALGLFF